jgi:hypothetical protein
MENEVGDLFLSAAVSLAWAWLAGFGEPEAGDINAAVDVREDLEQMIEDFVREWSAPELFACRMMKQSYGRTTGPRLMPFRLSQSSTTDC